MSNWIVGKQGAEVADDPRVLFPIVSEDGMMVLGYAYQEDVAQRFADAYNSRPAFHSEGG